MECETKAPDSKGVAACVVESPSELSLLMREDGDW